MRGPARRLPGDVSEEILRRTNPRKLTLSLTLSLTLTLSLPSLAQPVPSQALSVLDALDSYIFEARKADLALRAAEEVRKVCESREAAAAGVLAAARGREDVARARLAGTLRLRAVSAPFSTAVTLVAGLDSDDMLRRRALLDRLAARQARDLSLLADARALASVADFIAGMERANSYAVAAAEHQARQRVAEEIAAKKALLERLESDPALSTKRAWEMEAEHRRMAALVRSRLAKRPGPVDFGKLKGKVRWPLAGSIVKLPFGDRVHPAFKTVTPHPGLTLAFPGVATRNVRAVAFGKTVYAARMRGYGLTVVLDHASGWYTVYAGLADVSARDGQVVQEGDMIGTVERDPGESGVSLYFELRHDDQALNPLPYLVRIVKKKPTETVPVVETPPEPEAGTGP